MKNKIASTGSARGEDVKRVGLIFGSGSDSLGIPFKRWQWARPSSAVFSGIPLNTGGIFYVSRDVNVGRLRL